MNKVLPIIFRDSVKIYVLDLLWFSIQAHAEGKVTNIKAFKAVAIPFITHFPWQWWAAEHHPLTKARLCSFCIVPLQVLLFHVLTAALALLFFPANNTAKISMWTRSRMNWKFLWETDPFPVDYNILIGYEIMGEDE